MKSIYFIFLCFFSCALIARNPDSSYIIVFSEKSQSVELISASAPDSSLKHQDKTIAAFLSFPFPLGILGGHRIYMGAKPYIPLVYIGTLGGCFGILPLIDFIVLISHNDIEPYRNDKIFMWLK